MYPGDSPTIPLPENIYFNSLLDEVTFSVLSEMLKILGV